jgi:hypothetical protein
VGVKTIEIRELGISFWVEGGVEFILIMPKVSLARSIYKIYVLSTIYQINLCHYMAWDGEPEPPFPVSGRDRFAQGNASRALR